MSFKTKILNTEEINESINKLKESVRNFKNSEQKFEDYLPMFSAIHKLYKQFDFIPIKDSQEIKRKIDLELKEVINEPIQLKLPSF